MHARVDDILNRSGLIRVADNPELASTLRRLLAAGSLVRPFPGLYLRPHELEENWLRAVCAWSVHAVIHGRSAAAFWLGDPVSGPIELVSTGEVRPCPGLRVTRRRRAPGQVVEHSGLRLVTPAYALAELAATDDGRAAERGFRQRLVTPAQLEAAGRELAGTTGNAARARVIAELATNPWSAAERRLHALLRDAGITGWVANVPLRIAGRWITPDVRFDAERLVIEVDGFEYHSSAGDFQLDRERQNLLTLAGYRVLRFTWDHLDDPDYVLDQIRAALSGRIPVRLSSNRAGNVL